MLWKQCAMVKQSRSYLDLNMVWRFPLSRNRNTICWLVRIISISSINQTSAGLYWAKLLLLSCYMITWKYMISDSQDNGENQASGIYMRLPGNLDHEWRLDKATLLWTMLTMHLIGIMLWLLVLWWWWQVPIMYFLYSYFLCLKGQTFPFEWPGYWANF